MPDSLVDLGGGVKMLNPSELIPKTQQQSPIDTLTKTLSLVNLVGQVQDQPIERAKKEADLKLAENNVKMIDTDNAYKYSQLVSSINSEKRSQNEALVNNIGKGIDLLQTNPQLGAYALSQIVPGLNISDNGDGSFVGKITSPKGESKDFLIDPLRLAKPEVRRKFEGEERNDFAKNITILGFKQQSQAYRNMLNLKDQASGAGDVGILYSYIKLLDPNSAVREGEVSLGKRTTNVPESVWNLYDKAVTSGGPIFGTDPNAPARQNFIKAGKVLFKTAMDDTKSLGQNTYKRLNRQGLDGYNTLIPVGGLEPEDFLPIDKLTPEEQKASYIRQKKLLGE